MCYACDSVLPVKESIGFRTVCPGCGRPLHVCRNCRFYKPGAHWDCAETVGEPVDDKEKGNFCEWFEPKPMISRSAGGGGPEPKGARKKFDDLFKS